jgi:branched-chain amino acid transport system permease protein
VTALTAVRVSGLRFRLALAGLIVLLAALAVTPFVAPRYQTTFFMLTFMYITLATSWNIGCGYTGYFSFGHAAFFGLGAYATSLLIIHFQAHWVLAAVAGGLLAAAMAAPLGFILLRLRGPYFTIAMLGFAAALQVVALTWTPLTRGGSGLNLPPTLNLTQSYVAMGLSMVAAVVVSYLVITSRYGLRLVAIREDEGAADSMGINTTAHKVSAFVISAFFPGLVGGFYAWYLSYIDPASVFRPILSIGMVIMAMFGGAGTVTGPIIGAVLLTALAETFWARLPELHQGVYGALVIVVVLFLPGGLTKLLRSRGILPSNGRV